MDNKKVRTRYAPSPTGYMHIGNLRTALYEYLIAKKYNGSFIFRLEDTDQTRFVEGATEFIYEALKKAGIAHDEGPDIGGNYGPYIQSERKEIYIEYANKLIDENKAYRCFCTKERLQKLKEDNEIKGGIIGYDRHCRSLSPDIINKNLADNVPYVIRQKMPQDGITTFHDVVYGEIKVDNKELDDQVMIKTDGLPTYNFANVVDDHLMEITHVVRGCEYLSSTPKYNLLYESFGWEIPTYIHVPLIMKKEGTEVKKFSKRDGDASFIDLLNRGFLVSAIINYIALLGWSPGGENELFTMDELIENFSIKGISKSPATFDINKLTWMNGEYIRKMSHDEFYQISKPYIEKTITNPDIDLKKVSDILQPRTEVLTAIPETIDFFSVLPDYNMELFLHKKMKTTYENSLKSLREAYQVLSQIDVWECDVIHSKLIELVNTMGIKNGQLLWPVRTAITGKKVTPGGAVEVAEILGKEETLRRINVGIEKLETIN